MNNFNQNPAWGGGNNRLKNNGIQDNETDHQTLSSQKDIEKAYQKLQQILMDTTDAVNNLQGVNTQFDIVKETVAKALEQQITEAKQELSSALKNTTWDNLVIAFFGETNAGKSTIIETFRILFDPNRKKEDGLIVGDGQHDFTKTYAEYKLSIAGVPFTLIDVPGIEGNEDEFKDTIKTALHKAHCVFYVHGQNTKPDRATAEKIKKYLGDWVKVYSIYNVRNDASHYDEVEERETLLTPGTQKAESLIRSTFKEILGDVYGGHITLQALLAMSAKASFSSKRDNLIKTQKKLLSYFGGSADKILQFSQFQTLINLVQQKAANFKPEIIEANKQKLISLSNKIDNNIVESMQEAEQLLEQLNNGLRSVKQSVCNNLLGSAGNNIINKCYRSVDGSFSQLKQSMYNLIDGGGGNIESQANALQKRVISQMQNNISNIVRSELKNIQTTATRKIKELDGIVLHSMQLNRNISTSSNDNFSNAFSKLDITWGDVGRGAFSIIGGYGTGAAIGELAIIGASWAGVTLGAELGSILGPLGAGIGAAAGFLIAVFGGSDKKAKAKEEVSKTIGTAKANAKSQIYQSLQPTINNINRQKHSLETSINTELRNINELKDTLDSFDDDIKNFVKQLKNKQYGRI